ncbi:MULTISPECIES: alpha/beta hydrolase [unclassified Sphingomonas]|uniref:alpha/beta hydrolase n=1 Tax=unclassified Sphingomonas TaxID=196159 RepID=UPI002269B08B|nr:MULTISPECIES: alpha/beta hydrolase [unclassified Sphingomonas]
MRMVTTSWYLTGLAALLQPVAAPAADPLPVVTTVPAAIPLWPNGAPGSEGRRHEAEIGRDYWVRNIHDPSLIPFAAAVRHNTGAAVIVVPGGGHKLLVWTNEGTRVATAMNRMGVSAFVLKYRLAREEGSRYSVAGDAADDLRRAIRWVRAHATAYHIDPARLGVMGFSAGGELVTLVADNAEPAGRPVRDAIDRMGARPDFQVLIFPGPAGQPADAITHAPPAFIAAGSVDQCCAAPSVALYEQLRKARISAELHMYAGADHAFNLDETDRIAVLHWPDRLADWLADGGWLDGSKNGASDRGAAGSGQARDGASGAKRP